MSLCPRLSTRSKPHPIEKKDREKVVRYIAEDEYEYDDEDEEQSNRHFRLLPLMSLLSNCLEYAAFSERSLGKNLAAELLRNY